MWKALLLVAALGVPLVSAPAQNLGGPSSSLDVANLNEQVRSLTDQTGQLALRLEQLERQNAELRAQIATLTQSAVTLARLNAAVADLNRLIQSNDQATRELLAAKIKMLGDQTNAALDALAKGQAARAPVDPGPGEDQPKDAAIHYTVQPGDSLSIIAKKTGAKKQDIINANKLLDASKIQAGQILIIPGGKLPPPAP
jgi:LysM repeat protein